MLLATVGGPKQPIMYRYSVDNAVTYTSEDITLFRESPFACWMERLTLENPDHGIPPDRYSQPPANYMERQDELAETLRAEGKNIRLIDWDADEPVRRSATLEAMRRGTDFIVNGQLALGPLSGSANLLMRTSGFSELGNYLYIPCDTQAKTTLNSAFRLCFLADLLHSLQGQLPPQMLIIRGGSDLLPLETEDHIYHYRAVKHRFMQTMRDFRKHRMPDPAESAQFGRWSECANEVLKQRALRGDDEPAEKPGQEEQEEAMPLQAAAGDSAPEQPVAISDNKGFGSRGIPVGDTLASRAQELSPRALQSGDNVAISVPGGGSLMDSALQNLEFIGSSSRAPSIGGYSAAPESPSREEPAPKPAEPQLAAPEPQPEIPEESTSPSGLRPHPLDSTDVAAGSPGSSVKMATAESPPPELPTDSPEFEVDCVDDSDYQMPPDPMDVPLDARLTGAAEFEPVQEKPTQNDSAADPGVNRPFSSSLNTADFEDI